MTKTETKKESNSLDNLINDYCNFIFKILAVLPFNFESVKKFILGSFTRKDYNIEPLTSFKEYIKYYIIQLVSIVIGFWWSVLIFLLIGLIIAPVFIVMIIFGLIFLVLSIFFQLIYFYISAFLFKIIANYFDGDLNFNESITLVIYAAILQMAFMIPIVLSYGIFIGLFLSPILSIIPFYALYFMYKELNVKFKMDSKKAAYTIISHFIIENVVFFGLIFGFYILFVLFFSVIPLFLSFIG
jgi:hypothetical protein